VPLHPAAPGVEAEAEAEAREAAVGPEVDGEGVRPPGALNTESPFRVCIDALIVISIEC
jgi:hypothetical protein